MIAFLASGFCYLAFLLFESFAIGLDRISSIKLRGLLEEHPDRARILSGPGEMEIIRTTTKVLVQALLLAGLLTVVSGFHAVGLEPAWAWGGAVFLGAGSRRRSCFSGSARPRTRRRRSRGSSPS